MINFRFSKVVYQQLFPFCYFKKGIIALLFPLFFFSCTNKTSEIEKYKGSNTPDQTVKNARIIQSSNGIVQVEVTAPLVLSYEGARRRTEYPKGVFLRFLNPDKTLKATLSAKYAVSNDEKKMMEAQNNVVIIDYRTGDTIYTEKLTWDQQQEKIYTNNLIKCVGRKAITYGDGFESDDRMDYPRIKNQRGTIEWEELDENQQ